MKLELGGQNTREIRFLAEVVVWSGEDRDVEFQGRVINEGMGQEIGEKCVELEQLVVRDECARVENARIECDEYGNARVIGKIVIPVEAEFKNECGGTYISRGESCYAVNMGVSGVACEECGRVVIRCRARELSVQTAGRECVNYSMRLDVYGYVVREEIVGIGRGEQERESELQGVELGELARGAAWSCGAGGMGRMMVEEVKVQEGEEDEDAYRTVVKMPVRRRR